MQFYTSLVKERRRLERVVAVVQGIRGVGGNWGLLGEGNTKVEAVVSRAQILKYVRRWIPQSGVMWVGVDRASPDRLKVLLNHVFCWPHQESESLWRCL